MEKKKGNGLVIFLVLVILVMGGFITYDKVLKDKYFSNNNEKNKTAKENTKTTTEEESNVQSSNSISNADELYQKYLNNLKENVDKTYNNMPATEDEYEFSKNHDEYNYGGISSQVIEDSIEGTKSTIDLSDGKLSIEIMSDGENKTFNVDNNVLQFFVTEIGNGGFHCVYYIKENGKIYESQVEALLSRSEKPIEIKNLKNIVGIISSGFGFLSGWQEAIFIDIEGNLFRIDENNNAIKLNK